MYFLYFSFPHSCYLHEEGETERESEAVLLLPITLSGCPVLTPPRVQVVVNRRHGFQSIHLPLGASHMVLS